MKTLVYILPDKDAGVASVVRNLLRFKTKRFATKVILLHNLLDDASRRIEDDFNADKIIRITYHGKWSSKYSVYKKINKEFNKDAIVISNDGGIELDALNYLEHPISVVYILHGNIKHYYNAIHRHQKSINTVVTVSDFLKEKLTSSKLKNIVESIKFPVPNAKPLKRTEDVSKIRLIFVGSLISAKGIFDLDVILSQLNSRNVAYSLTIIGSGTDKELLKRRLENFPLVNFLGKLSNQDVLDLHKHHDIILLPSKTEGLPVVLVEAMKYGVVPLASQLESGIPEIISHGVTGFMIPLENVSNYADFIEQLHLDRPLLNKMSELCIHKAEQMFNPLTQTKHYEDAFSKTEKADIKREKDILDYLPMTIAHRLKLHLKK